MKTALAWPRTGGGSLTLVLIERSERPRRRLHAELSALAAKYGVDVGHGSNCADALVRGGLTSLAWLEPDAIFPFRCPQGYPLWEAAPLLGLGEGTLPADLVRAGADFLKACAETALAYSSRIAFVAAHEWNPGDRVRFESGTVDGFVAFATGPMAWSTQFLGLGRDYVVNCDTETPFWYEVSERQRPD